MSWFFFSQAADEVPNILDRCLVLNVEHDFARAVITYTAIHPAFAEVPEGSIAPWYDGVFVYGRRSPYWQPR